MGAVAWPTEREYSAEWLRGARRALGEAAFARAWETGQRLSLAQAVALADALTPPPHPAPPADHGDLSPRERQVAVLIARGLTNKQVAAELVVSPATVRSHVEHILTKLDLRSRAQIAVWASQQGLLREPPS
jgi:non-specific serine/threonine protein kinase